MRILYLGIIIVSALLIFACQAGTAPVANPHPAELSPGSSATSAPTAADHNPVEASSTQEMTTAASSTPQIAMNMPSPTAGVPAPSGPILGGCSLFPADNPWNADISAAPVHPRSAEYIQSIGADIHLHADFGSNPEYGIPYRIVPANQPRVPIEFVEFGDESDPGPYPIPPDAPVEFGSDHHVLVLASGECKLYELYHAQRNGTGWQAGSGAVFDLRSNALRPDGWTSADAAGLPMLPGLARFDEVQSGAIRHALRFTVENTGPGYIHPATHIASDSGDPKYPPMGLRLRLRADFDMSPYTGNARVILEALRRYGMIIADNGSNWFLTGAKDSRWNDEDLNQLKTVPGSAFEAVYTGETQ